MIVDFHTHIFSEEMRRDRAELTERDAWFGTLYADPKHKLASAEDVIREMDDAGVDHSVVMGFPWRDGGLCRAHNDYLLESIRKYPDRLSAFATIQPLDAQDSQELERCLAGGMVGMGELGPDGQKFDIEDKWVLEATAGVLAKYGRPLLVHSSEPVGHQYGGKGKQHPWRLLKLAENFPNLKIVLAHWGGGLPFYELMPEVRELLKNVYYDTAASTYLYSFDVFKVAAQIVGSERILWGTDYPLLSQTKFLRRVRDCGLSDEALGQILGGNAAALLGIREKA